METVFVEFYTLLLEREFYIFIRSIVFFFLINASFCIHYDLYDNYLSASTFTRFTSEISPKYILQSPDR